MFRSHPVLPEPPAPVALGNRPRILVVKLATLGDLLLATPALRALRLRYPDAQIDVLTTDGSAALLRDSPLVDTLYTLNKYAFDDLHAALHRPELARQALAMGRRLRSRRYDALLLPHHLTLPFGRVKYRALVEAIGARCTVGLDNGWGGYLDVRTPDLGFGWRHELDYNLAVAEGVDARLTGDERAPRVTDLGWHDIIDTPKMSPPMISLHPGSGRYSVARRWPVERWAMLAQALHDEYGAVITLIGGPDEPEVLADVRTLLQAPGWLYSSASEGTPRELAKALKRSALLVANDSFPMHLATAVGTPVVAVFGPSNARAWGPDAWAASGTTIVVRRDDLQCSPCFYRGQTLGTPQGCAQRPCLTALPLQPVLAAARRLLERQAVSAVPVD